MNVTFAHICPEKIRATIQKRYREGYESGLKARPCSAQGAAQTTIVIGEASPKKVLCKLSPFTEHYEAWGATELEAKEKRRAV